MAGRGLRYCQNTISICALLLVVVACDANRIERPDYAGFTSYAFSQGNGLGYCPDSSMAFAASIERRGADAFEFGARVLRPAPTSDGDCPSRIYADEGCMTVEALQPRRLSDAEVARVKAVFSALEILPEPDAQCEVLGIDPCRIDQHEWDGTAHGDYVCSANRIPPEQSERLLDLLSDLLAATDK